jgi:DNA-directed RNA polymerase subunit beta'
MGNRLYGRLVAEQVVDPQTGEILAERDDNLNQIGVRTIVSSGVQSQMRSPFTCENNCTAVCAKCYGMDLGGARWSSGSAVGIVAAQSIGEPGTG